MSLDDASIRIPTAGNCVNWTAAAANVFIFINSSINGLLDASHSQSVEHDDVSFSLYYFIYFFFAASILARVIDIQIFSHD